jgi:hypothetical protein
MEPTVGAVTGGLLILPSGSRRMGRIACKPGGAVGDIASWQFPDIVDINQLFETLLTGPH